MKYLGPHHFAICFGSVHALNTRSRGASMMRVMISSRPTGDDAGDIAGVSVLWFAVVISGLLLLKFVEVVLQAVKSLLPQPAVLLRPGGNVLDGAGLR